MNRSGIATALVAVTLAAAPLHGQDTRGQSGKPTSPNPGPADTSQHGRADSRSFIDEMAVVGMAEVQLGRMAAERASDPGVKAFGQMMVTDHTQAGNELKQVASQMNVSLPTQIDGKHRELADKLSKLQGGSFDREYINAMVQGHQEVAAKLRAHTATPSTSDTHEAALTQWATKALPTVERHLMRARELQQKVGK